MTFCLEDYLESRLKLIVSLQSPDTNAGPVRVFQIRIADSSFETMFKKRHIDHLKHFAQSSPFSLYIEELVNPNPDKPPFASEN